MKCFLVIFNVLTCGLKYTWLEIIIDYVFHTHIKEMNMNFLNKNEVQYLTLYAVCKSCKNLKLLKVNKDFYI